MREPERVDARLRDKALPSFARRSKKRIMPGGAIMFGWRRRSEGFEWREYVRTTILVRRADRQRRLEDARMAALAKVKNAADVGAEAGRASVSKAGDGLARLASVTGEALLDVAVAIFGVLARWTKFAL